MNAPNNIFSAENGEKYDSTGLTIYFDSLDDVLNLFMVLDNMHHRLALAPTRDTEALRLLFKIKQLLRYGAALIAKSQVHVTPLSKFNLEPLCAWLVDVPMAHERLNKVLLDYHRVSTWDDDNHVVQEYIQHFMSALSTFEKLPE